MKKEWNIYFLLFDCVEVLDFTGSFDVFSMANLGLTGPQTPCTEPGRVFKLHTVSQHGGIVTALHGLRIEVDYSFETCPNDNIDVLIIPGASTTIVRDFIKNNPKVIEWVAHRLKDVEIVASVCVGALILGTAGGFDQLQCTTHHAAIEALKQILDERDAHATIIPGARYVDNESSQNPRILSSAGVSAGIDQAFYMLRNILGNEALARNTAIVMEYNETANWVYGKFVPIDWDGTS